MTTAPARTLYGPDGRALTPSAPQPTARATSPRAAAGDWQPVTTLGNGTIWEKTTTDSAAAPAPQPAAAAATATPTQTTQSAELTDHQKAATAHYERRIAELEAKSAAIASAPPLLERPRTKTTPTAASPAEPKRHWFDRHGPKIAMYAAVGLCASGEYALAQLAGFPGPIAALLPIAMDVYVIQAMRRHRDVAAALLLSVLANALDRLAEAHLFGVDRNGAATWWLIVAVVAIAPFIVWRVHRITETRTATATGPTPKPNPKPNPKPKSETAEAPAARHPEVEPETAPTPKSEVAQTPKSNPKQDATPNPKPEAHTPKPKPETATPKPETRRPTSPKRPTPKPEVRNATASPLSGQRAKKAAEVEVVLQWMTEAGGPKGVPMRRVEEHFGLSTTTAYDRWKTAGAKYAESTRKSN